jgi:ketosteroid isomerase-like protein
MRLLFVPLAILCLLPLMALAQKPQSPSALKQMVETEQAFSKSAEVKNTREAFMAFIADDGLLWRPRAVNGKKWMNEHPVTPSDKRPLLAWQPMFAEMAQAGDLGYTTGPWEFKNDINDTKPSGYGHFVTLWKKQADGSWKFVVDLGISHPTSGGPLIIWQVDHKTTSKSVKTVDVVKVTESLLERDRSYAAEALKLGVSSAFLAHAASDARLYLPENLPFIGRAGAVHMLATMKDPVTYQAIAGDVSRSGDLGYTHGTYEKSSAADPKKISERGNYLRIWKKHGAAWQIVLDVTNPVP